MNKLRTMAIYSPEYGYIFNLMPSTASRSVRLVLQVCYRGQIHRNQHSRLHRHGFTHYGIIRNPYHRMLSLWASRTDVDPKTPPYHEFLNNTGRDKRWRFYSQSRYYKRNLFLNHAIRFENIDEEFSRLPFVKKAIHIPTIAEWKALSVFFGSDMARGERSRVNFNEVYSDKRNVKALLDHSGKDFERFGYSTEVPDIEEF